MRELVTPNLHVVLIHLPVALLIVGTLIELFSFCWRRSSFRTAGRWMILLGALSAIPTATSGIYAFRDVVGPADSPLRWADLVKQTYFTDEVQFHHMGRHIWLNSAAALLSCLVVITWIGCSDNWRRKLHWPLLVLLVAACGLVTAGNWHAGEMVYRHGIGMESLPSASAAAAAKQTWVECIKSAVPPIQLHLIAAGMVIALALAALGLSIRAISAGAGTTTAQPVPGDAPQMMDAPQTDASAQAYLADVRAALQEPSTGEVPSTRFWLLAVLAGLATAAAGLWVAKLFNWHDLKEEIEESPRILAHTIFGVSIIVVALVLTIQSRWGKRSKLMLWIFASLLVLAVAGQIWIGTLLLFDTDHGSVTRFNSEPTPATKPAG